jgi:hypothetical protein
MRAGAGNVVRFSATLPPDQVYIVDAMLDHAWSLPIKERSAGESSADQNHKPSTHARMSLLVEAKGVIGCSH